MTDNYTKLKQLAFNEQSIFDNYPNHNHPEKFYERETYDIYYTRKNGYKGMVVLNANGRQDAKLTFFKWNRHENRDTTIDVILDHGRISNGRVISGRIN